MFEKEKKLTQGFKCFLKKNEKHGKEIMRKPAQTKRN